MDHRLEYFKSADFWGLAGPKTPKEGYLTFIFIQTDLRENVEHRLKYFKSADFWGLAGPQTPKEG